MKKNQTSFKLIIATLVVLFIAVGNIGWCQWRASQTDPVVGSWVVKAADAPFTHHMFVFHKDGTMGQANPDAGNPNTSDSDGAGIWERDGDKIRGKFVEVTANRDTHTFAARGEISFEFMVDGDTFNGTASANFYDESGAKVRGPLPTPLAGQRVTLP